MGLGVAGQYLDVETGLHYNWHRFYDPETGRYISADPIGLDGGINLYAYVGGNPIGRTDPKGLHGPKPGETSGIPVGSCHQEGVERGRGRKGSGRKRGKGSSLLLAFAEEKGIYLILSNS